MNFAKAFTANDGNWARTIANRKLATHYQFMVSCCATYDTEEPEASLHHGALIGARQFLQRSC